MFQLVIFSATCKLYRELMECLSPVSRLEDVDDDRYSEIPDQLGAGAFA